MQNDDLPTLSLVTEDTEAKSYDPEWFEKLLQPPKQQEAKQERSSTRDDEKSDDLEKLCGLLTPEESEIASSWSNEISDICTDLQKQSLMPLIDEKLFTKQEVDRLTMSLFTEKFKKAMLETRVEMQLGDNMMRESLEDIEKIFKKEHEPREISQSLQTRIAELLKDHEYIASTPSEASEAEPPSRKVSNVTSDAMSSVWRILETRSHKERIQISSPGFDAYKQEQPHWLNCPAVSWKSRDFSKHKCEKWLNEQHDA